MWGDWVYVSVGMTAHSSTGLDPILSLVGESSIRKLTQTQLNPAVVLVRNFPIPKITGSIHTFIELLGGLSFIGQAKTGCATSRHKHI